MRLSVWWILSPRKLTGLKMQSWAVSLQGRERPAVLSNQADLLGSLTGDRSALFSVLVSRTIKLIL